MDIGIPMTFNGIKGVFVSDKEYAEFTDVSSDKEYVGELETEVHNHRNTISDAKDTAYELYRLLDNS